MSAAIVPLLTILTKTLHPFIGHMEIFFEILKYTIPALIVFATAYFLLQQQIDEQQKRLSGAMRRDSLKLTLPLRLQAYERLMLLCDRASIPNTLLRVRTPGMSIANLRGALMIAITQEFDHNTSQQLYVSDTLWQILRVAKDDTLSLISKAAEGLDPNAGDDVYIDRLLAALEEQGEPGPLQRVAIAVRTEAGRLF